MVNEIEIFNAALKLSAAEQTKFLDLACKDNPEQRKQIEQLLQAHFDSGTFLHESDGGSQERRLPETISQGAALEHPGTIIAGRYKLLEAIGEGGMGSVWVAEQSQPVKRKVALKLIKAGMDSKSVLARFEAERQALAVMDHPNIAKVLDGGLTEQGRPYFVMEYVKGIPITEYCDSRQLSVPERLELFAQVCQAVQHAHQKGIIHRDLKPSNILVAPYDDKPVPKVIDFGLAKAIHQSLTENTLHTAHDMVLGTPLYMSPEQAQLNNIDIDTRSDIYSLGVLLYELLTGSTPLEKQRFKQAAWDEMRRMIREEDPPRPSLRLSSAETLPSVAAGRHTEPARLTRLVRGELDWIVMKALEKDRTRRYETANGFAADVLRYLSGEPVNAAPPSARYRFQKFIRRNKAKVIAASLVLLALLAGMAGTSWQWYRAEKSLAEEAIQRTKAEVNERAAETARAEAVTQQTRAQEQEAEAIKQATAAKAQEAEAKKQAAIAEAVAKFQTDMLAAVDPNQLPKDPVTKEPLKDSVTVLQAMMAAVKALDEGSLKDQPLVEARVRNTIGSTLQGLGSFDEAEPNLQKSLEIRRAVLPAEHRDIAMSLNNLALLFYDQSKLVEAEPLFRESLEIFRAGLPPGDSSISAPLCNLGLLLQDQNRLDEAEVLYREAMEINLGDLPVERRRYFTISMLNNFGTLLQAQNKLAEAESRFREALELSRRVFPAGHPEIAVALNNLATLLKDQNKLAEAEAFFREALEISRAALPAGHPKIATGLNNLASLLQAQNKLAEAEQRYREALKVSRNAFAADHPQIALVLNNMARVLETQNKLTEAEPLFREALEIRRAAHPVGHPEIALGLNSLAGLLQTQNKLTEAEPLFREALEIRRAAHPAGHPEIARVLSNLGLLLRTQHKLAEAESLLRESLEIRRAAHPAGHPNIATGLNDLAVLLQDQNRLAEAEPLCREALEIRRSAHPAGHPNIANSLNNLAALLRAQNKLTEAEPLHREALKIVRAALPAGHPKIATNLNNVASVVKAQGRLAEAEPLYREALEIFRDGLPAGHMHIGYSLNNVASLLKDQNKLAEAEAYYCEALVILREALPAGHPDIAISLRNLADLYATQGKTNEAVPLLREVLESSRAALPKDSPELAGQLATVSLTLLTLKAWDEAEPLIHEALTIREKVQPDAWTTFNTKSMLGGALLGQKKFAESEPLLLAGYEGLKQRETTIPEQSKVLRLPEALERLVQLYTDWHTAEPDKGYDAKAAEWQQKLDEHNAALDTENQRALPK
jgi:eukaryotic-like serine/threonine-protein kinase